MGENKKSETQLYICKYFDPEDGYHSELPIISRSLEEATLWAENLCSMKVMFIGFYNSIYNNIRDENDTEL